MRWLVSGGRKPYGSTPRLLWAASGVAARLMDFPPESWTPSGLGLSRLEEPDGCVASRLDQPSYPDHARRTRSGAVRTDGILRHRTLWRNGIENAAGNPIAALIQAPLGELLDSPARKLIERLLDEGVAVARAAGVEVQNSYRESVLRTMSGGRGHLPSMAEDVRAGRPTEVTQLNEQIARRVWYSGFRRRRTTRSSISSASSTGGRPGVVQLGRKAELRPSKGASSRRSNDGNLDVDQARHAAKIRQKLPPMTAATSESDKPRSLSPFAIPGNSP